MRSRFVDRRRYRDHSPHSVGSSASKCQAGVERQVGRGGPGSVVQEMDVGLKNLADKEIVVGERLNIETLLRSDAQAGYGKVGVVVCGPEGMCDAVRAGVLGLGRSGKTVFELEVDAYSW